tara:strand:+ start:20706 stop:21515 length:810 start_codon:yes stop_codon:yes gene_type:complete
MHKAKKCQRHIWLLSGTGEGPLFAKALIQEGFALTISVVSSNASLPYLGLPLEDLKIGCLEGCADIRNVLKEAQNRYNGFDLVIDATHPFAKVISSNLKDVCKEFRQPLIRYERPIEDLSGATLINDSSELRNFDLSGQRILMAIGSRYLEEAVKSAREAGAEVFARVLPNPESLRKALASSLESHKLAPLRPARGEESWEIEEALCRGWSITGVLCRQSGGLSEKSWKRICKRNKIDLWMISRPVYSLGIEEVYDLAQLMKRVTILNQ